MFKFSSGWYPGELFYSFVGRNLSFESKEVDNWILNVLKIKNRTPNIQFSSYLNRFVNTIPKSFHYSNEFIIQHSTIFPLFAPFISDSRKVLVINKMVGDNPIGLYELLGVPGGHLFNIKKSLRYCPLCVIQDIKEYDEAYLHRIHHVDGVLVCPKHGCLLKEYANIDKLPLYNRFHILDTDNLKLSPQQLENMDIRKNLIYIACEANALMNLDFHKFDIESTRKIYFDYLKANGFLTYSGHVRIQELCFQFKQYYSEELLSTIRCDIDSDDCQNWIHSFFGYKNVLLHPIRHILLIDFLSKGVESFFNNDSSYSYFGKGPWPCLNPVAKHYKQLAIEDLRITEEYKTKRPVGTFTCTCGFVYSRRGPDKNADDKCKIGSIKQYGHEWESKLTELLTSKELSLRAISRVLKCDSKTVVKYGRKLGLENYISSSILLPVCAPPKRVKRDNKKDYEEKVLQTIRINPNCDKKTIREELPKEFSWLVKYDLDWLNQNVPVQRNYSGKKEKCVDDWRKIDAEILQEVICAYHEIMLYETPQRVTKTLLGHISGREYYLKNQIDKLPQTAELINKMNESFEAFKCRVSQ